MGLIASIYEQMVSREFYNYESLYAQYNASGVTMEMVFPPVLYCLVGVGGIQMNAFVVYVTVRSSTLNGTSNFLIALTSALEILHQMAHFYELGVALSGINFVTYLSQVKSQMVSVFALNTVHWVMALTAMDRLVYVVAPMFHRKLDFRRSRKARYLAGPLALCLVYGLWCCWVYYATGLAHPEMITTGAFSDINQFQGGVLFGFNVCTAAGVGFACYATVWLVLRNKALDVRQSNRIFYSLAIIMAVDTFGYAIGIGVISLNLFVLNAGRPDIAWRVQIVVSVFLNVVAAANGLVLLVNNSDYRKEFARFGGRLVRKVVASFHD